MATLVREGALSAVELVDAHLRQIGFCNPAINAFVAVRAQEVRAEAAERDAAVARGEFLGPLHGVPITVKDSFDVAGLPTRTGSRLRRDAAVAEDASAVARLRAAGAIVLGKTNTPEMLVNFETDNWLTGRTNNPYDLSRTAGGSSGGEASAIACFCSPGGLASDGGGSIRLPAYFCGIAGLKPTPGRVPVGGHFPALGHPGGLLTVAGPMARTARDLQLLFRVLTGYDESDPLSVPVPLREYPCFGARIGVWEQFYAVPAVPAVRAAVRQAAAWMEDAGFEVDALEPSGLERAPNVWSVLFQWPVSALRKLAEGREGELHWTLEEALAAPEPSAAQVLTNLAARDRMRASLLRQMEGYSAILMPTCGVPAFPHRERSGLFQAVMPAVLANALGLPAVTVPIALEDGLPIGVQLMGRPFQDELLLELAERLEAGRGAWTPPPVALL